MTTLDHRLRAAQAPLPHPHRFIVLLVAATLAACGGGGGSSSETPVDDTPDLAPIYREVSTSHLPVNQLDGACMDAAVADFNADGHPDLALAQEFGFNLVLINDGSGHFALQSGAITSGAGDNENLAVADFNGDGSLDIAAVHEDDAVHALLYNDGSAVFSDASAQITVTSVGNDIETTDVDGDGRPDLLLGNQGSNLVLLLQADGSFLEDPERRLGGGTTQDLLLLDIDADGDLDVFVANEGTSALYVNDGRGYFSNRSAEQLSTSPAESRQADAADVDADGDLDIVVGNVTLFSSYTNRKQLLLNDGAGNFSEATEQAFAAINNVGSSYTIHFVDADEDGDADLIVPSSNVDRGGSVDIWLNDGRGVFTSSDDALFDVAPSGALFDVAIFDADSDGDDDLYLCHRVGTDQLYLRD